MRKIGCLQVPGRFRLRSRVGERLQSPVSQALQGIIAAAARCYAEFGPFVALTLMRRPVIIVASKQESSRWILIRAAQ